MDKINRLKAVLAEQEKSGKWLAEQLGKSTRTVASGVVTQLSLTYTRLNVLPAFLRLTNEIY
jgi:hypothetical protein